MITAARFYGGAHAQTIPSPPDYLTLNPRFARFWTIRAGASGLHVILPDLSAAHVRLGAGCDHLLVWNDGSNAFDVQLADASVLCTIGPDEAFKIEIASNASRAWATTSLDVEWTARKRLHLS